MILSKKDRSALAVLDAVTAPKGCEITIYLTRAVGRKGRLVISRQSSGLWNYGFYLAPGRPATRGEDYPSAEAAMNAGLIKARVTR